MVNAFTELSHLESEAALKRRIFALSARRPSALQTAYCASCLLHGRLYWNSADSAPIETRPLLLYYGAASFAKALILAKSCMSVNHMATSHGMSCFSGDGDLIGNYVARASEGIGLFQQFNDVVASLARLHYVENSSSQYHYIAAAPSSECMELRVTLQQVLARVPEISETYALCLGEPASLLNFQFNAPFTADGTYEIRVDLPQVFHGREGMVDHVEAIRRRAPFLRAWAVSSATHAWDNSIVTFFNYQALSREEEISSLVQSDNEATFNFQGSLDQREKFSALESLPTLAGGQTNSAVSTYVEPFEGKCLSEYSTLLIGLLALSSLVRYQPHLWTSSVHRRAFTNRAIDDQLLPVIEAFLEHATRAFPQLVTSVLLPK